MSVQLSPGRFFDKGGLERRTFCPVNREPGTSLSSTFKIEVGRFGFMCFSFVNRFFFAYRLLLTRRCKLVEVFMTLVMNRSQKHGRRGQQDTREDKARK